MLFYNSKTKELTTSPPWGNSWINPDIQADLYSDWIQVPDDFIPPAPVPDEIQLRGNIKNQCVAILQKLDFVFQRQKEQEELVAAGIRESTKLTKEESLKWLEYRDEIRDFPEYCDPFDPQWPTPPGNIETV
jgi:hypothetical protein